MPTCYSGGAEGADQLWGSLAEKNGHVVVHFSFKGHQKKISNRVELTYEQLIEADEHLIQVNKFLKRTFPTSNNFVNALLRRNYWQVRDTDAVYAIGYLDSNGVVAGGTAWAVYMAINLGVQEIYFFDQAKSQWNFWNVFFEEFQQIDRQFVPVPQGKWTGIGSRKLTDDGIEAILELLGP